MERCIVKGSELQYLTHPWIYAGNIVKCEAPKGACVEVYTRKGSFLGSAIFNPDSTIALRFYSRRREELNYFTIKERLILADERRKGHFRSPYYRAVYSECDELPGLLVDRYGEGLVFQINSYGTEERREDLIKALYDAFSPSFIVEKSSGYSRNLEGLPEREEVVLNQKGLNLQRVLVEDSGFKFYVDLISGQKTGYFYDQRKNREILSRFFEGGALLDLFSYIGTFSIILSNKASKVFVVDVSEEALQLVRESVRLNGLSEKKFVIERKDAFEFLKEIGSLKIKFNFIVLDPPSFARRAKDVENAVKSYSSLLSDSIELLEKGGFIALFSCTNHIKWEHLHDIVSRGIGKSSRTFRIAEYLTQDFRDHPVLAGFPESEYLRGFLLKEDNS